MRADHARLEPLELGQLFDHSLRLYRRNLWLIFALSGLAFAAGYIVIKPQLQQLLPTLRQALEFGLRPEPMVSGAFWLGLLGDGLLLIVSMVIATTLAEGLVVEGGAALYQGREVDFKTCLRRFAPKIPKLILTRLLALAIYGVILAIGLALVIGTFALVFRWTLRHDMPISQAGMTAGIVSMILPGLPVIGLVLWLVLCWVLVPEIVILENKGYLAALLRSTRMLRQKDPRTKPASHLKRAAVLIVAYTSIYSSVDGIIGIFYWVTSAFFAPTGQGVNSLLFGPVYMPPQFSVPFELLITFFDAALQPLVWLAMLVLYYDIRARHEGYDLELVANRWLSDSPLPAAEK